MTQPSPPNVSVFTNSLIHEHSPYLLQHAHNPVQWYAWNEEAFAVARRQDKPIFLSIGYATCHWCHVMERESFENPHIARFLNEHFIAVKVDREERPDIDAIYMTVCQTLTGQGGWPLSIFMDADKKPFFAGTYFPPENHAQRIGFPALLRHIIEAWRNERKKIRESCDAIVRHIAAYSTSRSSHFEDEAKVEHSKQSLTASDHHYTSNALPEYIFQEAFARYEQTFDPHYGGFSSQPKFPSPQNLLFLLRYFRRTQNRTALEMVETTLHAMRKGGIFDHIGYGFHRYSTDHLWLLPHFEKMLYDQAMLALVYVEAYQVTRKEKYSHIAQEIFTYILRDMTDDNGGFYSAEDADSEGREGKFYLWHEQEIRDILGEEDGRLFAALYNCSPEGNFADEASGHRTGENILHLRVSIPEFAKAHGIDTDELRARVSVMRERLFHVRQKRIHPLKDDKILTDWNGLMIAALALGGRVLDNALYTQAAERSLDFIQQTMFRDTDGKTPRLLHRYHRGNAGILAFLDDYAFLAWGTFELYQATFTVRHLETTLFLCDEMLRLFENADAGGLYFSASDNEQLILRTQESYDTAIPSGNSVAAALLVRVGRLTSRPHYVQAAARIMTYFKDDIMRYPTSFAQLLVGYDILHYPGQEIIIAGSLTDPTTHAMIRSVADAYLPHAVVALNHMPDKIKHLIEQAEYQTSIAGAATLYICENFMCKAPLTTLHEVQQMLHDMVI